MNAALQRIRREWGDLFRLPDVLKLGLWAVVFADNLVSMPMVVCQAAEQFHPVLGPGIHAIPSSVPIYEVRQPLATLSEISFSTWLETARYDQRGDDVVNELIGVVRRVRVVIVKRGPKKSIILFYYGKVRDLDWDLERLQWVDGVPLMEFTSKIGRKMLFKLHSAPSVVATKWFWVLSPTYRLQWLNPWDKERKKKETGLLWAIWHRGVAVNAWRGKPQNHADQFCAV